MEPGGQIYTWKKDDFPPLSLFSAIQNHTVFSAANSLFEFTVWNNHCVKKLGWPELPLIRLIDTLALARSWSVPGKLDNAAKVVLGEQKDPRGQKLMKIFSVPQSFTKSNAAGRILLADKPSEFNDFIEYNRRDVEVETKLNRSLPSLSAFEKQVFKHDQTINVRGVPIDLVNAKACDKLVDEVLSRSNAEVQKISCGQVQTIHQTKVYLEWLRSIGYPHANLQKDTLESYLPEVPDGLLKTALKLRINSSSAAVKKLKAILSRTSADGRLRGAFVYGGANRTRRWASYGVQLHNFIKSCKAKEYEGKFFGIRNFSLDQVLTAWGDPFELVGGCLRGLIAASPGKEFICSDFSAIEVVVLAVVAGEEWKVRIFSSPDGKVYEKTGSRITGVPVDQIHKEHPARKIGKVADIAGQYQGWLGAWKKFGAGEFLTDDQIIQYAGAWRKANPKISDKKTGIWRRAQNAAEIAIMYPNHKVVINQYVSYYCDGQVLYCLLPSGRCLSYHQPQIVQTERGSQVSFMTWNTNPEKGKIGWIRVTTYGGKLVENIIQAISRDILANAIVTVEKDGRYPVVLHLHDELLAEVPEGTGSVEELSALMCRLPEWCRGWPIKADGWRGKRFRK